MSLLTFLLWFLGAIAFIAAVAFVFWDSISPFVRDSETLFLGRLQMLVGGVFAALLLVTDWGPVLAVFGLGQYTPLVVFVIGVLTEIARRSRATDL